MSFVRILWVLPVLALSGLAGTAGAFESTAVLPAGVRSVNIRAVGTDISEKTDQTGVGRPLAEPLHQDLTFKKIADGEPKLKGNKLRAFLLSNGFDEDAPVGEFTADLEGHLDVTASIMAYGITDRFTFAVAVPYYKAATSIDVGFTPNETGQAFLNALARPEVNQTASAREAGAKLNNAVGNLNDKLVDNGYRPLEDWESAGLGDVTVAGKYLLAKTESLLVATSAGAVLPTGRIDDPDILNDIGFGDGQADLFGQLILDQPLPGGFKLTEHGKYTVQLPGDKIVRSVTDDESIEVEKERVLFKLGDKVDAGASVVYAPWYGLVTGVGYGYFRKYGDVYREVPVETKGLLEDATDQEAHNGEAVIGYSTVPLYQQGSFAVPFELKLTYVRQLESRNMPVTDLAQFDLNLFF